ncbi:adenyl-nucleotide exchange factor sse1, partial [Spiromyces aspiralis]
GEQKPTTPAPEGGDSSSSSNNGNDKEDSQESEMPVTRKVKKLVKKGDLPVTQATLLVDEATLKQYTQAEIEMKNHDILVLATEFVKNNLEEYIYSMRDKVSYTYKDFVDPKEKDGFLAKLTEIEDWLYEDGDDAPKAEYESRLAELKGTGDPIAERAKEAEKRPEAARQLRQALTQWAELATSKDERYSHIPEEETQKVIERCEKAQQWLDEMLAKQEARPKYEAP